MNPLITKIQESEEAFDKKFPISFFGKEIWQYNYKSPPSEWEFNQWIKEQTDMATHCQEMIKQSNRSSLISLFQANIERLEGERKKYTGKYNGYVYILDQEITFMRETIKSLETWKQ
jgi:hypothetical protein